MKIEQTQAFKALDNTSSIIVKKIDSRKRIMQGVVIAKTIGYDKWNKITNLPKHWRAIVKELATV